VLRPTLLPPLPSWHFIYKYQTRFHGIRPADRLPGERKTEADRTRRRLAGWNMPWRAPEFSWKDLHGMSKADATTADIRMAATS